MTEGSGPPGGPKEFRLGRSSGYDDPIREGVADALGWILAVEDDRPVALALGRLVTEPRRLVRYVAVPTGRSAEEIVEERFLMGALVDLSLPDVSGFEVVERVKRRIGRPVPLAILTAHLDQANAADLVGVRFMVKLDFRSNVAKFLRDAGLDRWSATHAAALRTGLHLPPRALQILLLTAIGTARKEICAELGIKEGTLRSEAGDLMAWFRGLDLARQPATVPDGVDLLLSGYPE